MATFQLLESREEDELHKSRLLNVEEKPFKRITKRLLAPGSLLVTPSKILTPPPESGSEEFASQEIARQKELDERRQFREDLEFDFAAFNYSISRIQFLLNSNEHERERYKADKERISNTAQAVKDNAVQLRVQLEQAKVKLEQRKEFDKLAEKMTEHQMLKISREEQALRLLALQQECEAEEAEKDQYAVTWRERKEQFGRIVEEGLQLRRLIRDEKEEFERQAGMKNMDEEGEVEGGEGSRGGQTPKHSGNATPRPDSQTLNTESTLKPMPLPLGSLSTTGSRTNSRTTSPAASERRREAGLSEDSAMADSGSKVDEDDVDDTLMAENLVTRMEGETSQVTIEGPRADRSEAVEDGEAIDEDKMDTT
ncbi:hypothetical protein PZA11_005564 [Diplocarpon coronariae]|uniref:Tho complex subunit 7 n=1 Tax=Diplocarpon coronariae TaxID=2795749 RepID=A0A218Z065_9HELO|nr:hypothetical protein JHW43_000096 [Diplocarpon mali]OWP00666.1 hypothetical protein B2J93_533 [Marssonina coronariae]